MARILYMRELTIDPETGSRRVEPEVERTLTPIQEKNLRKKARRIIKKLLQPLTVKPGSFAEGKHIVYGTGVALPVKKVRSKSVSRQTIGKYLAKLPTIKKLLRIHKERKQQIRFGTPSAILKNRSRSEEEESLYSYYLTDVKLGTLENYQMLNKDVSTFAKDYSKIRRIMERTLKSDHSREMFLNKTLNAAKSPFKIKLMKTGNNSIVSKKPLTENAKNNKLPNIKASPKPTKGKNYPQISRNRIIPISIVNSTS